jgi:hypothetical protein
VSNPNTVDLPDLTPIVGVATPESWQRQVLAIAPPVSLHTDIPRLPLRPRPRGLEYQGEGLSWFLLVFEPGDPWQKIGRYIIWNMRPWGSVPHLHKASLYGPHPRASGSYNPDLGMFESRSKVKSSVDRVTYELFRLTGCYGQRYWVLQGKNGGHKYRLTHLEKAIAKAHGYPFGDTPAPGDLPYAPFDNRVRRHLLDLDRYRMWNRVSDFAARKWNDLDSEDKAEARRANAAIWNAMSETLGDVFDQHEHTIRKVRDWLPVMPGVKSTTDFEKDHENFVNDTTI